MVLGFFRHIYQYFAPSPLTSVASQPHAEQQRPAAATESGLGDLIPVLDATGQITAYLSRGLTPSVASMHPHSLPLPVPVSDSCVPGSTLNTRSSEQPLYIHVPGRGFIPHNIASPSLIPHQGTAGPVASSVVTTGTSGQIPPIREPAAVRAGDAHPPYDWDGWPNGDFELDFTPEEVNATKNLMMHWACKASGARKDVGSLTSETWIGGKKSTRKCLGIITCNNSACTVVVRPQTTHAETYIDGTGNYRAHWVGLLAHAHAVTLVIAAAAASQQEDLLVDQERLREAWNAQMQAIPDSFLHVDVDRECLELLEHCPFDVSSVAGEASAFQWGVDGAGHQDDWIPHDGAPDNWGFNIKRNPDDDDSNKVIYKSILAS
ncbi:hypothetical protein HGRIS_003423 [Hohenbuehelia grisea]|uniref:Uncharacterized protein n=1 Tax=Hohenbuehelia grisea TaxID=104357 RepID=A0ABR3JFI9_9AGAR